MVMYQWGIFWADLNPTKGSEQSGVRPVIVVSTEEANMSLPIVTVIALTSIKPGRKVYTIEAYLPSEISGLPKDSIAMAHQIRAVSKERLKDKCGFIDSQKYREKIKQAMKAYLDIV